MKKIFYTLFFLASAVSGFSQSAPGIITRNDISVRQRTKGDRPFQKEMTATLKALNAYVPGTTMDITFMLDVTNLDEEYGDSLALTFPAGIKPNSSPNNPFYISPDPMATPEVLNPVNGQVISWGDNDNNYGGITTPGTYTFIVNVTVDPGVTGQKTGTFHLSGDEYGPNPQDLTSTFILSDVAPKADLQVFDHTYIPYYSMPARHFPAPAFSAIVFNNGGRLETPVNVLFQVAPDNFTDMVPLQIPLEAGASDTVTSKPYEPVGNGLHTLLIFANYPEDQDLSDNADTTIFDITPNIFSYNSNDTTTAIPLGVPRNGGLGARFDLQERDSLTATAVYFENAARTAAARVAVYRFVADTVGALITASPTVNLNAGSSEVLFKFNPALIMEAGSYVIAVEQMSDSSFGVGTTPENFSLGTIFAKVDDTGYLPIEMFPSGFWRTIYLRPIFGSIPAGLGIRQFGALSAQVYPNPTNGTVNITIEKPASAKIYSTSGQLVRSLELSAGKQTLNLTDLSTGIYSIRMVSDDAAANLLINIIR